MHENNMTDDLLSGIKVKETESSIIYAVEEKDDGTVDLIVVDVPDENNPQHETFFDKPNVSEGDKRNVSLQRLYNGLMHGDYYVSNSEYQEKIETALENRSQ